MEEKTYTTDDILKELNISILEFQLFLINHRIARNLGNRLVLFESYRDWMIEQENDIFGRTKLVWTQLGHDNLVRLMSYLANRNGHYSTQSILQETGVSNYSFLRRLIDNGIIDYSNGNITLRDGYSDWGTIEKDKEETLPTLKWTELGRSKILELFVKAKAISSTNSTKKKEKPTQSIAESNAKQDGNKSSNESNWIPETNTGFDNQTLYSIEDILKEVNADYGELREYFIEKGIVTYMRGKKTILSESYKEWYIVFKDPSIKEEVIFWTKTALKNIIQHFGSKKKGIVESKPFVTTPYEETKIATSTETIKEEKHETKHISNSIVTANSSELQKVFKTKYVDFLIEQAKQGQSLANYASEFFPIEQENILYIPSIKHPIGLLEKMNPSIEKDFESAVALYEAYPNLSPLQAADKTFWVYLAHTELFPYVQNRYPQVKQDGFNNPQYILDHWFFDQGPLRHALAGLWWSVYLSLDNEIEGIKKYNYTKFIFSKDMNLRAIYFANSQLIRHKAAAIGILRFLMEDEELCSTFFRQRFRYIIKYFNKLGGTRQLVSLDRDFFYYELKKIRPLIMAIQSDEDVKNSI